MGAQIIEIPKVTEAGLPSFPLLWTRHHPAGSVPLALLKPHEKQAWRNHGQSLKRLSERGGLCAVEMVAVIEGWDPFKVKNYRRLSEEAALEQVLQLINASDYRG